MTIAKARLSLKRCPFCGSNAITRNERPEYATPMWTTGCKVGCATSVEFEDKQDSIEWWNRRYSGPRLKKLSV